MLMAGMLTKELAVLATGVRRYFLPFMMAMTADGELHMQHRGDEHEGDKETHDLTLRLSGRPVKPEDFTQSLPVNHWGTQSCANKRNRLGFASPSIGLKLIV